MLAMGQWGPWGVGNPVKNSYVSWFMRIMVVGQVNLSHNSIKENSHSQLMGLPFSRIMVKFFHSQRLMPKLEGVGSWRDLR